MDVACHAALLTIVPRGRIVQAEQQEILSEEYTQWSLARQDLVNKVKSNKLSRPTRQQVGVNNN